MREHAMVCSDYAIKTIELLTNGDMDQISAVRKWHIEELKKILSEQKQINCKNGGVYE